MFHIVFCGDEKYFKYIAVCMTSIVKNTIVSKSFSDFFTDKTKNKLHHTLPSDNHKEEYTEEKYVFHIISDSASEKALALMKKVENELSHIFPVEINIHILDSDVFSGQPLFRKNYLAYYRLKLANFVPKDLNKVLYLDGDTLLNCDIRELFAVDIDDHIAATVSGLAPAIYKLRHRHGGTPYSFNRGYYFNSGVMLINLKQFILHNIEEETLKFLRAYVGINPDQDALNAIIKEDVVKLPYKWNVMVHGKYPPSESTTMDESPHYNTQHTRADFLDGLENPKIIHYGRKPWMTNGFYITAAFKSYYLPFFDLWWDMVTQTPAYKDELEAIKESKKYKNMVKKNNSLDKGLQTNSFPILLLKLKRTIRPFMAALEKPFKIMRSKIRGRKIKA